jgi:hypothetical protein
MALHYTDNKSSTNKELVRIQDESAPESSSPEIPLYSGEHCNEGMLPPIPVIKIPGISTEKGLEHFGGNVNTYWNIVKSFARNTTLLLKEIRSTAFPAKNVNDYAIIVHGIKRSSLSIGAEDLGIQAEALEHAVKVEDLDFVRENHNVFIQAADQLLERINAEICRIESNT